MGHLKGQQAHIGDFFVCFVCLLGSFCLFVVVLSLLVVVLFLCGCSFVFFVVLCVSFLSCLIVLCLLVFFSVSL